MLVIRARHGDHELTPSEQQAKLLHESKLKNRDASVDADAFILARLQAQSGYSPLESMKGNDYWDYVKEHDRDYWDDVVDRMPYFVDEISHELENPSEKPRFVPQFAPKKQQGGGAGGPPMAAGNRGIKTADREMEMEKGHGSIPAGSNYGYWVGPDLDWYVVPVDHYSVGMKILDEVLGLPATELTPAELYSELLSRGFLRVADTRFQGLIIEMDDPASRTNLVMAMLGDVPDKHPLWVEGMEGLFYHGTVGNFRAKFASGQTQDATRADMRRKTDEALMSAPQGANFEDQEEFSLASADKWIRTAANLEVAHGPIPGDSDVYGYWVSPQMDAYAVSNQRHSQVGRDILEQVYDEHVSRMDEVYDAMFDKGFARVISASARSECMLMLNDPKSRVDFLLDATRNLPDDEELIIESYSPYGKFFRGTAKDFRAAYLGGGEAAERMDLRKGMESDLMTLPAGVEEGFSLATGDKWTRTAASSYLFLKRTIGPYRLMGTLVGNILVGRQQYLKPDGKSYRLVMDPESATASKFGPSAKEALRIQEELPMAIMSAAEDALSTMKVDNAKQLARVVVRKALRAKKFSLIPVAIAVKGVSIGFLLMDDVPGTQEPEECQELRVAIGKATNPYIQRLLSALAVDGIQVKEVESSAPAYTEQGKDRIEDVIGSSGAPEILAADDIMESLDVKSLAMTASSKDAAPDCRALAAQRLCYMLCRFPSVYDKDKLSPQDVEAMASASGWTPDLKRLLAFVSLYSADDAAIMEAYANADPSDKLLMSHLVCWQDRRTLMDSVPEMSVQDTPDGETVNHMFLSKMDVRIPHVRKFIAGFWTKARQIGCIEKIIERKAMEALSCNPRDEELLSLALGKAGVARNFALALLLENGESKRAWAELESRKRHPGKVGWHDALACLAFITREGSPGVMKLAWGSLGATPRQVMDLGGRRPAELYMMANRIDIDGEPVPEASMIISAPDDPLPLAKCLSLMGDYQGMIILLRLCAKRVRGNRGEGTWYAMTFLKDALSSKGYGKEVDSILSETGVNLDDDKGKAKWTRQRHDGSKGVFVEAGLAFAAASEDEGLGREMAKEIKAILQNS